MSETELEDNQRVKQVLVVRSDLKWGPGRLMAMAAHASVAALINKGLFTLDQQGAKFSLRQPINPDLWTWMQGPYTKVVLKAGSLEELEAVYDKAHEAGLITSYHVEEDEGADPVPVSIAIGPAKAELIDPITKHLKLW